jgi:hypothetical protein
MLDRRGGQLDRGAVAETAAATILPLRPAPDDAGTDGLQFAQAPHRRRQRCPWKVRDSPPNAGGYQFNCDC